MQAAGTPQLFAELSVAFAGFTAVALMRPIWRPDDLDPTQ